MKKHLARPALLICTFIIMVAAMITFSQLAKARMAQDEPATEHSNGNSIIFETITGNLLSIRF